MNMNDNSAQIDGTLRFGNHGGMGGMGGIPIPSPSQKYHHAESVIGQGFQRNDYMAGTPVGSSVRIEPPATHTMTAMVNGHNGSSGVQNSTGMSTWKKVALAIGIIIALVAIGVAVYVALAQTRDANIVPIVDEPSSATVTFATTPSAFANQPSPSSNDTSVGDALSEALSQDTMGGVEIGGLGDGIENTDASTTYYYPSPMPTPCTTPVPREHQMRSGSASDGKPPPGSWFGADAPTRGDTASEMALDGEFGNQAAMEKIYGGNANSVLGGKNKPPFATVNQDAARQIGWAEIGDESSAPLSANQIASGSARSMSELYESNMQGREFRDGSSASTLVTPDQAAHAAVGNNPDRTQQFEEGRERSKAITAESAAAIGSIYDKKRKAAAGLSAAAMAKQRETNDTNFDFYDTYSQKPM